MRIPTSGLTLVKKVVQQQKGAEFVTWPGISSQLSQLLQHGISVLKQPKGAEFLSGRFHPSGGLCYTSTSTHDLGEYPSFGNDHLGDGQVGAAKKKNMDDWDDYISWTFSQCCILKNGVSNWKKTQSNFEFQSKNLRLRSLWIVGGTTWVWCQIFSEVRRAAKPGNVHTLAQRSFWVQPDLSKETSSSGTWVWVVYGGI